MYRFVVAFLLVLLEQQTLVIYAFFTAKSRLVIGRSSLLLSSTTLQDSVYLYNTLSREKEKFLPIVPHKVSFYSCGPTVYDYAHIGNFRAFLTYDLVKRWLEYAGYSVDHVCNLTDVDDKIIVKMASEGKSLKEVTEKYTAAFFEDLDVLNIKRAGKTSKTTIDDTLSLCFQYTTDHFLLAQYTFNTPLLTPYS